MVHLNLKRHSQNSISPNPNPIATTDEKIKEQENSSGKWMLQFRDLPEVARRPVTSRLIYDIELKSGDSLAFMSAIDYKCVAFPYPKASTPPAEPL